MMRAGNCRGDTVSSMKNSTTASILSVILFMAAWFILESVFVQTLAVAYVPLFLGGFILWWFTTRKTPVDPHQIIVPYLLTVISFIAHVLEEYKAFVLGFPHILQGLPFAVTSDLMVTFAGFLAPILWLLGSVMSLKRWQVGYFIASTFLFGMMFIEPTHFIAPFLQDGTFFYVGGMLTAVFPIILGWYTFLRIRKEIRKMKGQGEQRTA